MSFSSVDFLTRQSTVVPHIEVSRVIVPPNFMTIFNIQDLSNLILDFSTPSDISKILQTRSTIARIQDKNLLLQNAIINIFLRDRAILPRDWSNFRKVVPIVNPPSASNSASPSSASMKSSPSTVTGSQELVVRPVPLPDNLRNELLKNCPFNPGKIVAQTHYLLFEPDLVNGDPLTVISFSHLMEHPANGSRTFARNVDAQIGRDHGNTPLRAIGQSGYALITQNVLPTSRNQTYNEQLALIATQGGAVYESPSFLEMVVLIAAVYNKTGIRLYGNNPLTCTHCKELCRGRQIVVGNCTQDLVRIFITLRTSHNSQGIAARKNL